MGVIIGGLTVAGLGAGLFPARPGSEVKGTTGIFAIAADAFDFRFFTNL